MQISPETEFDNIEYKLHINKLDNNKIQHYITQLNYRLYIGQGICYYYIGVNDWGTLTGMDYNNCFKSYINFNKILEYNLKHLQKIIKISRFKIIYLLTDKYVLLLEIKSMDEIYQNSNILAIF